ncbi:hypothetical protein [Frankia sp. QA3]|uniref:hypothetical protein n=1 Tax=Frankia sp. QA3 TaxID=710111 RepID=UPI000269CE9C|nr:hypothetical protein [Frankia sp. QA3]EIV96219.1 hypothetical protein FraQA3DRAFT_6089 [Frankia sp. QA3]
MNASDTELAGEEKEGDTPVIRPASTAPDRYRFGAVEVCSDVGLTGYERYRATVNRPLLSVTVRRGAHPPSTGRLLGRGHGRRGPLEIRASPDGGRTIAAEGLAPCTLGPNTTVTWHLTGEPTADDTDFLVSTIVPWTLTTAPGTAVLHAASLVGPRGAVLLCGPSGAGKSTLSTALHHHRGWRLFGDDAAVIRIDDRRPVVLSCSREVRLWADAADLLGMGAGIPLPRYSAKSRHPVAEPATEPAQVVAVVQLVDPVATPPVTLTDRSPAVWSSPHTGVSLSRLRAADGIAALRGHLMRLALMSVPEAAAEFAFLTSWHRTVTCAALHYPHIPEALPEAVTALSEFVGSAPRNTHPASPTH